MKIRAVEDVNPKKVLAEGNNLSEVLRGLCIRTCHKQMTTNVYLEIERVEIVKDWKKISEEDIEKLKSRE